METFGCSQICLTTKISRCRSMIFITLYQGADYYGLGLKVFTRMAREAGSVYKIGKKVLIRRTIFDEYSYTRLPQQVTAAEGRPGVLALMAITGWLLSNPKGYRAPAGGLKVQLKRYFRAGARFEKDWDAFTRNHLKLTRAPIGENCFYTFYDLYWRPMPEIPALRFLTAQEGRTHTARRYMEPTERYTKIPVMLLKDESLSPAAKGVVILALRELDLQKNVAGYTATKQAMQKACGLRAAAFETAWQEAKDSGYIRQERLLDETTGRISWGYSVAITQEELEENCCQVEEPAAVSGKEKTPTIHDAEAGTRVAGFAEERQAVQELVKENIGYAQLLQTVRIAPLYYHKEDIDAYVRLIVDTVCSTLPTVRIGCQAIPTQRVREALLQLCQEHILYVMECLSDAQIEHNPRAYKLTALYNAAITYSEYAMGLTA